MKFSFVVACVVWCLTASAYPWGREGHSAIAEAAKGMLTPRTKANIEKILGNDDLSAVAVWLDDVRNAKKHHSGPLKDDPEAKEFNAKFPNNEVWHYVDLPVGFTKYSEDAFFASKDDIVHAIGHAVDVLEGKDNDMTDQQALKVLVHLVGDAHQPLHAAAGYFDCSDSEHPKLVGDPELAKTKPHDRGGNQLFYTKSLELHALWDTKIVQLLIRVEPRETLAEQLAVGATAIDPLIDGDYHQWSERWIEDSARIAIYAYRDITLGQATLKPDGSIDRIEVALPEGYLYSQAFLAKLQLTKAAARLARLLNAIRFK